MSKVLCCKDWSFCAIRIHLDTCGWCIQRREVSGVGSCDDLPKLCTTYPCDFFSQDQKDALTKQVQP